MNTIGFFTPVKYCLNGKLGYGRSMLQGVDNYFFLGGRKLHIIDYPGGDAAIMGDANSSLLARIVKLASYLTLVLPVIFLLAKAVLRYSLRETYNIRTIKPEKLVGKTLSFDPDNEHIRSFMESMATIVYAASNKNNTKYEVHGTCIYGMEKRKAYHLMKQGDRCEAQFEPEGNSPLNKMTFIFHGGTDRSACEKKTVDIFKKTVKLQEDILTRTVPFEKIPAVRKFTIKVGRHDFTYLVQENEAPLAG